MSATRAGPAGLAIASFVSALLFGAGLVVSGMTTPSRIAGFLNPLGGWDPSLVFVMIGAIAVHAILFRVIMKRRAPLCAASFAVPTRRDIDGRLVLGAALFGAGWALAGVCPGPGVVALPGGLLTGSWPVLVFLVSMFAGMKVFAWWDEREKS